jgi:cell division protein ZapA
MSNVVLAIGGREYAMACAAGEEAHIRELGRMIDDKLSTLPDGGTQNDSRSLLFVADELHELRKSAGAMPKVSSGVSLAADASPEQLVALAERLEALVEVLGVPA